MRAGGSKTARYGAGNESQRDSLHLRGSCGDAYTQASDTELVRNIAITAHSGRAELVNTHTQGCQVCVFVLTRTWK